MLGQPSEFQRYVDLLATLGLAPGANVDAIRHAWRERMRQVHPDRFPGDKAKEQQAKALNEAKDGLEEMAKDGRLQTFATVAERTRRTGGTDTIGWTPSFTVLVVIAPAGTGKTLGWVKAVSLRGSRRPAVLVREPLHIVMASPTISLIDQTASELALRGLQAPLVKVIHSENVKGSAPCVRAVAARIGSEPLGARIASSGSVLTGIQGQDSGAAAAAGEFGDRGCLARGWCEHGDVGALAGGGPGQRTWRWQPTLDSGGATASSHRNCSDG